MENLQSDLSVKAEINLYYDLYIPENIEKPAPLLAAIHGYGANKGYMMREARRLAEGRFVVVSLQGPHQHFQRRDDGYRIGFGWLTDHRADESIKLHQKFLLDVLTRLASEGIADEKRLYLLGFSQACALNFRFALTHPNIMRGIIGICGGIPSDLEENLSYRKPEGEIFYLYSDNDEFYTLEKYRSFEERMRAKAKAFSSKEYSAAHEITDEMREDIKAWLIEKMESHSKPSISWSIG